MPRTSPARSRTAAMLVERRIIAPQDGTAIARGSRENPRRDRNRHLSLPRRARGHPPQHRGAAQRDDRRGRPGGCTPRARATTRSRPTSALGARRDRPARSRRSATLQAALIDRAEAARGDRHARLHPSADRAAGDVRPPSAGLCRDAGARPRAARGRAPAAQRMPAGRGGAGRHLVSDRPRR